MLLRRCHPQALHSKGTCCFHLRSGLAIFSPPSIVYGRVSRCDLVGVIAALRAGLVAAHSVLYGALVLLRAADHLRAYEVVRPRRCSRAPGQHINLFEPRPYSIAVRIRVPWWHTYCSGFGHVRWSRQRIHFLTAEVVCHERNRLSGGFSSHRARYSFFSRPALS